MIIVMIKNANRICGKAQGYLGLPVRDVIITDKATGLETPAMETAWTPTPDELERLNKGANIIVRILGQVPAPMLVLVDEEIPEQPKLDPLFHAADDVIFQRPVISIDGNITMGFAVCKVLPGVDANELTAILNKGEPPQT